MWYWIYHLWKKVSTLNFNFFEKICKFLHFFVFLWIHAYFRGILWRLREFSERFFPFFWGISEKLWKFLGWIRGFSRCFGDFFYLAAVLKRKLDFLEKFELLEIFFSVPVAKVGIFCQEFEVSVIFFLEPGAKVGIFWGKFELLWWVLISFWCVTDSFKGFFELLEIFFSVSGAKVRILRVDLKFKGEFLGNLN